MGLQWRYNGMGLLHTLKINLLLPVKRNYFQLNRIKSRDFFIYIIFLHLLISLPNGIRLISNSVSNGDFAKEALLVLIVYPLLIILLGISGISLLALVGMIIKVVSKRKLVYQLLWKMTVYSLTYPVLLYVFFDIFDIRHIVINLLGVIIFINILLNIVLAYPKIKKI
jgi:hypothetical protein